MIFLLSIKQIAYRQSTLITIVVYRALAFFLSHIHEAFFSLAIRNGLISQEKAMDGVMRSAGVSGIWWIQIT